MRSCYGRRSALLHETIMLHAGSTQSSHFTYQPARQRGVHTYLKLEDAARARQVIQRLQKKFIRVETADAGYLDSFVKEPLLKLNVSSVKEPDIESGIEQVIREIG